jgi:acetylornithine deacetylase/succinyl-diaminopimelate desuccinylase-like protein
MWSGATTGALGRPGAATHAATSVSPASTARRTYERERRETATVICDYGEESLDPIELSNYAGLVAIGLLTANILIGLLLTRHYNPVRNWPHRRIDTVKIHNVTGWTALAVSLIHPALLLLPSRVQFAVIDLFYPVNAPKQPWINTLGAIAVYLLIIVLVTSYFRFDIGRRRWKMLHFTTYALFPLYAIHSIFTDPALRDRSIDYLDGEKVYVELCVLIVVVAIAARWKYRRRGGRDAGRRRATHPRVPASAGLAGIAALLVAIPAAAQRDTSAAAFRSAITNYRRAHEAEILGEFRDLLAIPNRASDSVNIRRNASMVSAMLQRRGVTTQLLASPTGGPPVVYGELRTPGATKTVVLYAHYDGQPVEAGKWATPPWEPTLRDGPLEHGGQVVPFPVAGGTTGPEWRLYARSAGDDKAPIIAMLVALDALRANGMTPSVNLKFYFDGEEEAGNGHTRALLERHAALLASDGWVFADGPVHQSRRQQVLFGVRGVTDVVITAYGATRALHSGHYGNWAPKPAAVLANFVASMRDADGKILIPGYYDDVKPLTAADRRALRTVPAVDSALRQELDLGATEANDAPLAERIMQPALNVRAFHAGPMGAAANAIPTEATVSIDFRLVPDERPERIRQLVEAHAAKQGYTVIHAAPDSATRMQHGRLLRFDWGEDGYPGQRTRSDTPLARGVVRAVTDAIGAPIIEVPMLGGSLPTYLFAEVLTAPLVIVPIANHDDNQHASNENLRLQNLWDGITVFAGIEARLGHAWSGTP